MPYISRAARCNVCNEPDPSNGKVCANLSASSVECAALTAAHAAAKSVNILSDMFAAEKYIYISIYTMWVCRCGSRFVEDLNIMRCAKLQLVFNQHCTRVESMNGMQGFVGFILLTKTLVAYVVVARSKPQHKQNTQVFSASVLEPCSLTPVSAVSRTQFTLGYGKSSRFLWLRHFRVHNGPYFLPNTNIFGLKAPGWGLSANLPARSDHEPLQPGGFRLILCWTEQFCCIHVGNVRSKFLPTPAMSTSHVIKLIYQLVLKSNLKCSSRW